MKEIKDSLEQSYEYSHIVRLAVSGAWSLIDRSILIRQDTASGKLYFDTRLQFWVQLDAEVFRRRHTLVSVR